MEIHNDAFCNCRIIEYKLPNSLKYIGFGAFSLNIDLKKLIIPCGVEHIRGYIISFCVNLEELVIHDNISTISSNAFYIGTVVKNHKKYYKIPSQITIVYSSYEKLDSLLDKLIGMDIFDDNFRITDYKLRLSGPILSRIDSIKIYSKLLRLKAYSIIFDYVLDNDDIFEDKKSNNKKVRVRKI